MHDITPMSNGLVRVGRKLPYPYDFEPTFHRYKLEEPQHWKKPKTIFVCSMADLFGEWVPDEWIRAVFEACSAAPQHRYLFLTKAPDRYQRLAIGGMLSTSENIWYGTSTPKVTDNAFFSRPSFENGPYYHTFISIEPILERFGMGGNFGTVALTDWVIVGAETGNRKGRVIPQKEWIMELAEECAKRDKPIFMKESLRGIMGDDFRQEFPWETP
jgi:protein gp37